MTMSQASQRFILMPMDPPVTWEHNDHSYEIHLLLDVSKRDVTIEYILWTSRTLDHVWKIFNDLTGLNF